MTKTVEFYFDFGSPTAYLAFKRLRQLEASHGLKIDYRPVLLGGVFKATGNASPVTIPAKGAYMLTHDLPRFARRYNVQVNFNPHFPINTLKLMRGALAAIKLDCLPGYMDAMFDAMWIDGKNMGDMDVVREVIQAAGLPADELIAGMDDPAIKQILIKTTEDAVTRGLFGVPTLFMGDEMFFGQDRLDFVEEALA